MLKRLYFAEWFVVVNAVVMAVIAARIGLVAPSWRWILAGCMAFGTYAAIGVVARTIGELIRRRSALPYLRHIRRRPWLLDTARFILNGGLLMYAYSWVKISVPALNRRLFDQQLWDLDQLMFFGLAPTVLVLDLFGNDQFLLFIDWAYPRIFVASLMVALAYFMSEPSRRVRAAFINGNALMWMAGAWLYVLIPSLGPAYRFPDVWLDYDALHRTQYLQTILLRNYQNVLTALRRQPHEPINLILGIAAFPSLHVGFQTFVFFWMRRLWTPGEVLFAILAAVIFLGSMITGWHYLIDGIGGALLALLCSWIFYRRARMARFLRLF